MSETYVKSFLGIVDPTRSDQCKIEGQHPLLELWKSWYRGDTPWHITKCIRDGHRSTRKRKSSGIAKLIAEEWASNYANEDTKITVVKNDNIDKQIQKILESEKVFSKFGNFVEKFMALGIGATVVMPSKIELSTENNKIIPSKSTRVKISFLDADRIIPITVDDGVCTECAFIKYSTRTCTLQMHILVNGKYEIHEVTGTTSVGGKECYNFDYSKRKVLKLDIEEPLFQIWHPNLIDNKMLTNQLGASIYADALDWFKVVDIILDSFYAEFKNGRKKRYVSTDLLYVDANGDQATPPLDDDEIYIPPGVDGKNLVQEFNGELRVEAYIRGMNFAINIAAAKCGMGDSKFRFDGTSVESMQTATGVRAKQTTFHRNIVKQENFAADRFKKMLLAIMYVNNTFTSNSQMEFEESDIEVVFDDNIVEDTSTKKAAELTEVQAGVMSIAEFRSHWYDEDYDSAVKFLQENAMLVAGYVFALQSGVMTAEKFVDIVYGNNCKDKQKLIDLIESRYSVQQPDDDYEDETDDEDVDE